MNLLSFVTLFFLSLLPFGYSTESPQQQFCQKMKAEYARYHWGEDSCANNEWTTVRKSVLGHPLIWTVFGGELEKLPPDKVDTTLILCGVHGDEITPIKFCFDIIDDLKKDYKTKYGDKLIIIAPVVNPDAFFKKSPTRTNANGVDLNRNFPTGNWKSLAHTLWKNTYRSDPRRNPGPSPLSEPEVVFQINLIKRYHPDKIISVHSPLTMLDYDGPGLKFKYKKGPKISPKISPKTADGPETLKGKKAFDLLLTMSQKANGYRVRQFKTYPGSLGNWAGLERKIPTYTLELPSSDPSKTDEYWRQFSQAINEAILNNLDGVDLAVDHKKSSGPAL